jgi:hypothetical protein
VRIAAGDPGLSTSLVASLRLRGAQGRCVNLRRGSAASPPLRSGDKKKRLRAYTPRPQEWRRVARTLYNRALESQSLSRKVAHHEFDR